jgi:chromate reductase, NAD(P)H dehydrogenase (quinone)
VSATFDVVALVGSLRRNSLTRRMTQALAALAPTSLQIEIVAIGDLPLYDQDLEESVPPSWQRFRERVRRCDAVLFATPEYNRSIPGALKNAIDVGSRPPRASVWSGKPAAVASMSPGALGGFGANHHLRQTLVAVGMPALPQPELYLSHVDRVLTPAGEFADAALRKYCAGFLRAFDAWVARNPPDRP